MAYYFKQSQVASATPAQQHYDELAAGLTAVNWVKCSEIFPTGYGAGASLVYATSIWRLNDGKPTGWYIKLSANNGAVTTTNVVFNAQTAQGVNFDYAVGTITTSTTSSTVTGVGTTFVSTAADANKVIFSKTGSGATSGAVTYVGQISTVTNATTVVLAANALIATSGAIFSSTPLAAAGAGTITTVTSSNAPTCSGTAFAAADVGKALFAGTTYIGIIATWTSATSITLVANAANAVTSVAPTLTTMPLASTAAAALSTPPVISVAAATTAVTSPNYAFTQNDVNLNKVVFAKIAGNITYIGALATYTSDTSAALGANTTNALTNSTFSMFTPVTGAGTISSSSTASTAVTFAGSSFTSADIGKALFTGSGSTPVFVGLISAVTSSTAVTLVANAGQTITTSTAYLVTPVITTPDGSGAGTNVTVEYAGSVPTVVNRYTLAYDSGFLVCFTGSTVAGSYPTVGLWGVERSRDFTFAVGDDIGMHAEAFSASALTAKTSIFRNAGAAEFAAGPHLTLATGVNSVLPVSMISGSNAGGPLVSFGPYLTSGGVRYASRFFCWVLNADLPFKGVTRPVLHDGVIRTFYVPVGGGDLSGSMTYGAASMGYLLATS